MAIYRRDKFAITTCDISLASYLSHGVSRGADFKTHIEVVGVSQSLVFGEIDDYLQMTTDRNENVYEDSLWFFFR